MRTILALICFSLFLITVSGIQAQVNDNFSDGNFTSSPTWSGDNTKFAVASNVLWLNAPAVTDVAFLSTPSAAIINNEWQFYNVMNFNPSSSNFCRFYLVSDQRNFNAPNINGYYVELGRLSDEISLYKVISGSATKIIDGPDDMLNVAACTTRVKVTRTGALWELWVDATGGSTFVSLGTFTDALVNETYFLGAYCKYTATRSDKFFFDDVISTGTNWTDVVSPSIITHTTSTNVLSVQLNEPVLSADLTSINFGLDNGLTVVSIVEDSLNSKKLNITASGNFATNLLYHLTITTLHDLQGNTTSSINYPFILHIAVQGEIVINEIMVDPTPQLGLPDAEFVELRNNSIYPISLNQWEFKVGSTSKILPPYVIQPNDYVVLMEEGDTSLFASGIKKLGIASFQSLTNGGEVIQILDTGNVIIDQANYSLEWYHDPAKDDGGYTIERINPNDICLQSENWAASVNINGGTPGVVNSVYNPSFVSVNASAFFIDSVHVLAVFNQLMDPAGFILSNFTLTNLSAVQTISADSCVLFLSSPLTINTTYNLTIGVGLQDCGGVSIPTILNIPVVNYTPQLFDVLITELMVDETPVISLPSAEYIEIYNSMSFAVNTSGWTLVVNGAAYTLGNYSIPADSFIVFVDNGDLPMFTPINSGGIASFGGMTNENGVVELYHSNGSLLHSAKYDINYYDVAGKSDGGWSLEMIDKTKPCLRNSNWTASQDALGGSPGRRNSYSTIINDVTKPHAIKTGLITTDTVVVYFDESILPSSFNGTTCELTNGNPLGTILYSSSLLNEYYIKLLSPIPAESVYYLRMHGLSDCEGNMITVDSLPFSIPQVPNTGDIIINEILADPTTNCIDYVEIYNLGTFAVDLSQMILGEGDTSTLILTSYSAIHNKSVLLHPGEYLMVSEDHETVMNCYGVKDSSSYWDIANLPDFTNTAGTVGISMANQTSIDMFAYNEDMHFSALGSTDGVSLERLDINGPTQNSMNWHSAASTVGFGTPGYQNSQFSSFIIISDDFTLDPEIFSPDLDGYQDYLTIYYNLANAGYVATLRIYDQAGRLEKLLVNNQLLGTSGSFVWDGTNDNGGKVNVGIHIIYFELIGGNGEILSFKKPVVVATRF